MRYWARLGRRRLLAGAIGGGALLAGAGREPAQAAVETLFACCAGLDCSSRFGSACLAALPSEETPKRNLVRSLLDELPPAAYHRASRGTLARWLREQSRRDFATNRIVSVRGWMLSRTETRLYALAALQRANGA